MEKNDFLFGLSIFFIYFAKNIFCKMKKIISTIILCGVVLAINAQDVTSPNGKLSATTVDNKLVISYDKQKVLELADVPFDKLELANKVKTDYKMLEGKRLHCTNEANEYQASIGQNAKMVMRLYNDGIAFRYDYAHLKNSKVPEEKTSYPAVLFTGLSLLLNIPLKNPT